MGLEGLGLSLDLGGWLIVMIALGALLSIIALFLYFYASKMHPKVGFKIYSRTGVHTRSYRLYYGKFPTTEDIIGLLLGKKPIGFPIRWFRYDYYDGRMFYVGQFVEGRLFPLPIAPHIGLVSMMIKKCPKCGKSEKEWGVEVVNCRECDVPLAYENIMLDGIYLQSLKYSPEVEKRCIYSTEIDKEGNPVPLSEWIVMYDIGAKIAEAMDRSDDETKHVLEQNNPFITAIIASLPLTITLLAFGFVVYIMMQGMGSVFREGSANLLQAVTMMNQTRACNLTG